MMLYRPVGHMPRGFEKGATADMFWQNVSTDELEGRVKERERMNRKEEIYKLIINKKHSISINQFKIDVLESINSNLRYEMADLGKELESMDSLPTCGDGGRKMNFGQALEQLKLGSRIAREGWNGKGMSVALQKGYPEGIPANKNTAETWGIKEGELFKCRPYLQMRCADGTYQMWLASQSDILADDWVIILD